VVCSMPVVRYCIYFAILCMYGYMFVVVFILQLFLVLVDVVTNVATSCCLFWVFFLKFLVFSFCACSLLKLY
jgi:hypothetical protein